MSGNNRTELAHRDLEALMRDDRFLRFLFTVFSSAPMFSSAYGAEGRHLHFAEGRRSLGFDILRSAERIRPDVLPAVLAAEMTALKEYPDGNTYKRTDELDEDDRPIGAEGRAPGSGLVYLDYSSTADEPD